MSRRGTREAFAVQVIYRKIVLWRSLGGSEGGAGPGVEAKPACRPGERPPQPDSVGSCPVAPGGFL